MSNIIFVSIPRTGTRSVRATLGMPSLSITTDHLTAKVMRDRIGVERWAEAYKFAFVRNPFDRLVSWFALCQQNRMPSMYLDYTFDTWVRAGCPHHWGRGKTITTENPFSLCGYLLDDSGELLVDFVGRFERFGQDLQLVAKTLGVHVDRVLHINKAVHKPYRQHYSTETRKIVERMVREDLERFSYGF